MPFKKFQFPHLNASIYLEDAKFLDLISTMIPISAQSALFTFLSMFAVALLFISNPPVLFVATFSILSTSVGKIIFHFDLFLKKIIVYKDHRFLEVLCYFCGFLELFDEAHPFKRILNILAMF